MAAKQTEARKVKTGKARNILHDDGFYHYTCERCGHGVMRFRKRQRHPPRLCQECLSGGR